MEIGKTPLIKLSDKLYGKLESINPGGSIKDRPVKYILDRMDLEKGDTIIEATSGNTGISLSMMCAERGYKCIIVMPSDMSIERNSYFLRKEESEEKIEELENEIEQLKQNFYFDMRNKQMEIEVLKNK